MKKAFTEMIPTVKKRVITMVAMACALLVAAQGNLPAPQNGRINPPLPQLPV